MDKQILVVGSLNMDMVIEMDKMPVTGETILGKTLSYIPGGKGANQACAAGKLGGSVRMLGCVGADSFGERQIKNLDSAGVNTESICQRVKEPTGTAVIYVNKEGDNSIVVVAGANGTCDKKYLEQNDKLFQDSEFVVFQMEIPYEAICYGISRAHELGKKVVLNPAPAPQPGEIPDEILSQIDYLTPNETEVIQLGEECGSDMESIKRGAGKLLDKGVGHVLVTLGSQGVLLVDADGERIFPARKVQAVDTTAAGDCFNGALVTRLAEGASLEEAICFANCASSIAVTRKGAQSSIPQKSEVWELMHSDKVVC
ncbi:MAG: ribokinase [Lachnospiraceae bacterium]|nr:ribokinase [Lachnospiraceae bacterium]